MKSIKLAVASLVLIQSLSHAAVVSVDLGSGSYDLRNNLGTSLSAGNSGVNGDGALMFLGFYTDGTISAPFGSSDNNFVKLSGVGNIFGTANTTIGDTVSGGASDGNFFITSLLINDTNPNASFLPAAGTPLVVRILDKTALQGGEAAAEYKMEFANTSIWKWISPTVPTPNINIDLDDAGLRLVNSTGRGSAIISGGGPINANVSLAPIPEPSSLVFGLLTAMSVFAPRIRRRRE